MKRFNIGTGGWFGGVVVAAVGVVATAVTGCGGSVVVGGGGSGGEGGGSTSTSTGTPSTTGTPTPTPGCDDHADCPGGVCIFSSGLCSVGCDPSEGCGDGQICEGCATSSCYGCKDCMAACVPASPGQCDSHDDCGDGRVCLFGAQKCAPKCNEIGGCDDPNLVCNDCATSSCPFCEDCVGACTESF